VGDLEEGYHDTYICMLKNRISLERSVYYVCNKCPVEALYNVAWKKDNLHGVGKFICPDLIPAK
jgi:hypothetical protein